MHLIDHQAKLYARELLQQHVGNAPARIGTALLDAQVDLNPHQVDAALFAFSSPLSRGVILADEVGLGKTIEAGLVMTQRWAEQRRRILVVAPASLRKQWVQELADKFFLPARILETASFNAARKAGVRNPFDPGDDPVVVVCSYQFAARRATELAAVRWDLAVLDEAHRLRNVYKPGNRIASAIRTALSTTPKLLLTATPLQNTLMELYGLVSIIDEHHFGDAASFRAQYSRLIEGGRFDELQHRLAPVCHRTLRRQVVEYVSYTNRVPITQEFVPGDDEQALYDLVSDYLRRPELQALPAGQRTLMVLVMRKLLASSTFAIAGALDTLSRRLADQLRGDDKLRSARISDVVGEEGDDLGTSVDEWEVDELDGEPVPLTDAQRAALAAEITELQGFRDLAVSITENAKGHALLTALRIGFAKARVLGAANKSVIFTESRRTQEYLVRLLDEAGYGGRIVLFNGTNTDAGSKTIYRDWVERHRGTDRISGSRTADTRAALVDQFRSGADIMIATEAAAEGINLQFCSMVVNYDLPWNPQRIEQRIGRCHRYGQQHDVVVINFLNRKNAADVRVFELLDEKFRLFSGVFGASDEVLGSIESGVDIERRVTEIYQDCRTAAEIESAFSALRVELDERITETMDDTRRKLLENFDTEVHERLRVSLDESTEFIEQAERQLWQLTTHLLRPIARIDEATRTFDLDAAPAFAPRIPTGRYQLSRSDNPDAHRYRRRHPLATAVVDSAARLPTPDAEVVLGYSGRAVRAAAIESLVGVSGVLVVDHLRRDGEVTEDHLVVSAVTDSGIALYPGQARRLFDLPARIVATGPVPVPAQLDSAASARMQDVLAAISAKQGTWFDEEVDKLDRWAADKQAGARAAVDDLDAAIKQLKREARAAANLPDKLALQRRVKQAETDRNEAWHRSREAAREIELRKEELLDDVATRLQADQAVDRIMTLRFTVQ
ncbi:SNF2-related protein [Pseudonocardia sp.]|uniref:SNF2-related protein n=1 Tax=Pseudonocardia sp. TaxID=60912 RepID=UPI00261D6482|nr:SNF2-related protein [Pseudonocardia sp.]